MQRITMADDAIEACSRDPSYSDGCIELFRPIPSDEAPFGDLSRATIVAYFHSRAGAGREAE
jgi:hypothetical protein